VELDPLLTEANGLVTPGEGMDSNSIIFSMRFWWPINCVLGVVRSGCPGILENVMKFSVHTYSEMYCQMLRTNSEIF
jgi:hypothetical protein